MTGGADHIPEVRAPTIRGQMRSWLRSLFGGFLGDDSASVRLAEGAVMGHSTRTSAVAVRAIGDPRRGPLTIDPRALLGVQYMLWSAFQSRRECLLPGEGFRLRLQSRPFALPPVEVGTQTIDRHRAFDLALASLWLTVRLGSIGFRARRGAGGLSVEATPPDWPDALPPLTCRLARRERQPRS